MTSTTQRSTNLKTRSRRMAATKNDIDDRIARAVFHLLVAEVGVRDWAHAARILEQTLAGVRDDGDLSLNEFRGLLENA